MNRAATEDVRSPVWPVVSQRAAHRARRRARATSRSSTCSTTGSAATRRASTPTTTALFDEAGPDDHGRGSGGRSPTRSWRPSSATSLDDLDDVRSLGGLSGESYVDKDLRTLLGEQVEGPFNLRYCGGGSLADCRASLWQAVHDAADAARGASSAAPTRRPGSAEADRDRLRAGAPAEHVPDDEPPDLPAGPRAQTASLIVSRGPGCARNSSASLHRPGGTCR